ncbi:hypothetical protein TRFO_32344 [Tritrichomonas foetus]|uniref:Uncharacterized protein n=1 Tax=Tritrichomonas foetus TaxID=1144522 RepID=A0A1J4JR26_9EUKA|nr:hypothetical protein TRFO_32344 [Tritrichomonas foetus]|eukprot:OHT00872.1 hypothetical protein TRFO_32344 [Tritrichomonas foetus]
MNQKVDERANSRSIENKPMNEMEIDVALKEILDSKQRATLISNILYSIEESLDSNEIQFDQLDIQSIASSLHQIYCMQSHDIRASVLCVCLMLELISPVSITEEYGFDFLVANSIDLKSKEHYTKTDPEKEYAFKYVKVLLSHEYLPNSIIRSLISLNNNPDPELKQYKQICIRCLLEASLFCDDLNILPDIITVFFNELIENGSTIIAPLLAYAVENHLPIIQERTLSPLLIPLSNFSLFLSKSRDDANSLLTVNANGNMDAVHHVEQIMSNFHTHSEAAIQSLIMFMRTWPGLLYFGIKCGAINEMMSCINNKSEIIVRILKELIQLSGRTQSVTDAYSGLFLALLLKLDLIDKLNACSKSSSIVSDFVNKLLPFTSHSITTPIITSKNLPNNILFDVAQEITHKHHFSSINSIQLGNDLKNADWTAISILLNVVLPYNEDEATSSSAQNFYKVLFNFFSSDFLTLTPGKRAPMIEPLSSLINLLLNRDWGIKIIEQHRCFKRCCKEVISLLLANSPTSIDPSSSRWCILRCIMQMMTHNNGVELIKKLEISTELMKLGTIISDPKLAAALLDEMSFWPLLKMSGPVFYMFLSSMNKGVYRVAIAHLRKVIYSTPEFSSSCLEQLLIPHIKEIRRDRSKLLVSLHLLGEIIATDERALLMVAQNVDFHPVLLENSHFIFSLVTSREETANKYKERNINYPIDQEIAWWMEKGNMKYVEVFDKAIAATFAGKLDVVLTNEPSIFNINGFAPPPPHLFSQLSRTSIGVVKLKNHIPDLISQLESGNNKIIRAAMFALAHFSSTPTTRPIIESFGVVQKMINIAIDSPSYVVKGTLLSALTLFSPSRYLSAVLQEYNWHQFRFGFTNCLIPRDPTSLFKPVEKAQQIIPTLPNPPNNDELVGLIKKLINAEIAPAAKNRINEIFTSQKNLDWNLAKWINQMISHYSFSHEYRVYLLSLISNIPLMPKSESNHDGRIKAIVQAKFFLIDNNKGTLHAFHKIQIPTKSRSQLKGLRPIFTEVFVSDEEFKEATGITKEEFYALNDEQKTAIRQALSS